MKELNRIFHEILLKLSIKMKKYIHLKYANFKKEEVNQIDEN